MARRLQLKNRELENSKTREIWKEVVAATQHSDAVALGALGNELLALGTPESEARAHSALGQACWLHGDFASAIQHHQEALALYTELDDTSGRARALDNIGTMHAEQQQFPAALGFYNRALPLYEAQAERRGAAFVIGRIANVHATTGNYPLALEYYRRALAMHTENGSEMGIAITNNGIGNVICLIGDYERGLEHYRLALDLHERLGNRNDVAISLTCIGWASQESGKITEALECYHKALPMFEELHNAAQVARTLGSIISTLISTGEFDKASDYLDRQATLAMDIPVMRAAHHAHRALVDIHHNRLHIADEELHTALSIAEESGIRRTIAYLHDHLRDLAQKQNNFERYILHNNEYHRILEEINGADVLLKIAVMEKELELDVERKEKELQRLRAERVTADYDRQRELLAQYASNLVKQTEMLVNVRTRIRSIIRSAESTSAALKSIDTNLLDLPDRELNWVLFHQQFMELHPAFEQDLLRTAPSLSSTELKVCCLLCFGMKTMDIATLLFVSERTIDIHRGNIRKKLSLERGEDLRAALVDVQDRFIGS